MMPGKKDNLNNFYQLSYNAMKIQQKIMKTETFYCKRRGRPILNKKLKERGSQS